MPPISVSESKSTGKSRCSSVNGPGGNAAGLEPLKSWPSRIPPQTSSMRVRRVMPIGTSTRPTCLSGPWTVISLVPVLFSVPMLANHSPPLIDDGADVGEGLGVVQDGRALPEAFFDRAGRLGARLPAHAHDGVHQRRAFAADVGAAAGADPELDVLAGAEDVLADQAEALGVGDGLAEALDGERVLAADVVVGALGAAGDAGDEHAFEDLVRDRPRGCGGPCRRSARLRGS